MPLSTRRSFDCQTPRGCLAQTPEGGPFLFAEFVVHDSRLQFRSLDHVHAGAMNLLPLSRQADMAGLAVGSTRCRMDPQRTCGSQEFAERELRISFLLIEAYLLSAA